MAYVPRFTRIPISDGLSGWGNGVNQNMSRVETFLGQPTNIRAVYKVSAGKVNGTVAFLKNFAAASFTGCMVWVADPAADTNFALDHIDGPTFFPAGYTTNRKCYAYSNGTNWVWCHNDRPLAPAPA